jgi:uncharacterized protein with PIN domain
MSMSLMQALHASRAPFDRPICPECNAPMFIVTVEPDRADYESRTYECPNCKFRESSVVRC